MDQTMGGLVSEENESIFGSIHFSGVVMRILFTLAPLSQSLLVTP